MYIGASEYYSYSLHKFGQCFRFLSLSKVYWVVDGCLDTTRLATSLQFTCQMIFSKYIFAFLIFNRFPIQLILPLIKKP